MSSQLDPPSVVMTLAHAPKSANLNNENSTHPRRVPDRPTNIGLRLPSLRKRCNDSRCWRAGNAELTWLSWARIK
jgi:hypothetical protein